MVQGNEWVNKHNKDSNNRQILQEILLFLHAHSRGSWQTPHNRSRHNQADSNSQQHMGCLRMCRNTKTQGDLSFFKIYCFGVCVWGIHKVGVLTVGNLWESVLSLDYVRPEDLTVQAWQQASLLAEPSQSHNYHIFTLGFCKV